MQDRRTESTEPGAKRADGIVEVATTTGVARVNEPALVLCHHKQVRVAQARLANASEAKVEVRAVVVELGRRVGERDVVVRKVLEGRTPRVWKVVVRGGRVPLLVCVDVCVCVCVCVRVCVCDEAKHKG